MLAGKTKVWVLFINGVDEVICQPTTLGCALVGGRGFGFVSFFFLAPNSRAELNSGSPPAGPRQHSAELSCTRSSVFGASGATGSIGPPALRPQPQCLTFYQPITPHACRLVYETSASFATTTQTCAEPVDSREMSNGDARGSGRRRAISCLHCASFVSWSISEGVKIRRPCAQPSFDQMTHKSSLCLGRKASMHMYRTTNI